MENKTDARRPNFGIWICYFMILASIVFPMTMFYLQLRQNLSLTETIINSFVILLPFFVIPPRLRWSAIVIMWLVVVFYVTNKWYMRFFNDMMPLSSYFLWNNIDGTVIDTALSVMKIKDLSFGVLPFIATYISLFRFREIFLGYRFSGKIKIIVIAGGLIAYFSYYTCKYISYRPDDDDIELKGKNVIEIIEERCIKPQVCPWVDYDHIGFAGYITKHILSPARNFFRTTAASREDIALVDEFRKLHLSLENNNKKTVGPSGDKNLVFIIVESLNSWVIGQEYDGHKVTPVIDSLISHEGTLSALKMVTQVHSGVSSDGQFIYNTGIYPSSEVTTVSYYTGNNYNTLARILDSHTSFEVICESATMWNHSATTKTYGYDYLHDNINNLANRLTRGKDETMFDFAATVIDTVSRPYFAELTTISMHAPYKDPNVPTPKWIAGLTSLDANMRDYLASANYFDTSLGKFLRRLAEQPDFDKTLVIIAADHRSTVKGRSQEEYRLGFIPFIALNSGFKGTIAHPVGQVDVFPTILDMMGISSGNATGYMGLSMFNPVLTGAVTSEGKLIGDSISDDLKRMLEISGEAANIILRCNL